MPIQILALREFYNAKKKKIDYKEDRTNLSTVENAQDILQNYTKLLEKVPEDDKKNIFFTVQNCIDATKRNFEHQKYLFFDIDDIDVDNAEAYFQIFCEVLNLNPSQTCCILSGHGLHILVELEEHIEDVIYFKEFRPLYKAICAKLQLTLKRKNLPGNIDPQVFAPSYMVRMPGTLNDKPGREPVVVRVLYGNLEPVEWNWEEKAGIPKENRRDTIAQEVVKRLSIDSDAVQNECLFLRHCKENQNEISEPQWYSMLGIISRLDNGIQLAHEYSKEYENYSFEETELKVNQALNASGPRTCESINQTWDKCYSCKHFNKIKSPILIQGKDFIQSEMHQFWITAVDQNNLPKPVRPDYEGLRRFFQRQHPYVTMENSSIVYNFYKTHWQEYPHNRLLSFAQNNFGHKDKLTSHHRSEFASLVSCTNIRDEEWFAPPGKINLKNGILDLKSREIIPHNMEYGFRYVLPFDYDEDATCPRFDTFMKEVTCNREDLEKILLEYMAYCLSGLDPSWGEKAMILLGEGSNGKSVFMDVLRNLAGRNTYSSLTITDMHHEAHRFQLDGALFNISEETPSRSMLESSLFKNLVTGGEISVKKLYKQPYRIKNYAKLLLACNELPPTHDTTKGMMRRLLIIPFDATFEGTDIDRSIRKKLKAELPGILNRIIIAYHRLLVNEHFTDSDVVEGQVKSYLKENDSVISWCEDNLIILKDKMQHETLISELYDDYRLNMEQRKIYFVSENTFSKRLRKFLDDDTRFDRRRVNGRRVSLVKGIKLGNRDNTEDF